MGMTTTAPELGETERIKLYAFNQDPSIGAAGALLFYARPQVTMRVEQAVVTPGVVLTHARINGQAFPLIPEPPAARERDCFTLSPPHVVSPGGIAELIGRPGAGFDRTRAPQAALVVTATHDGESHFTGIVGCRTTKESLLASFEVAPCPPEAGWLQEISVAVGGQLGRLHLVIDEADRSLARRLFIDDVKVGRNSILLSDSSICAALVPFGLPLGNVMAQPYFRLTVRMHNETTAPIQVRFELELRRLKSEPFSALKPS